MTKTLFKSHFAIFILIPLVIFFTIGFRILDKDWNPIASDGFGYYLYLPQILKYQDLDGKDVWQNFNKDQAGSAKGRLIEIANGNFLNKYPIGTAILMLPFFLIADFGNNFLGQSSYFDGIYSLFMVISGIFYFSLAIILFLKILKKYFSSKVSNLTLLLIVLGSNIIHYAIAESTFSHTYSFFIFTLFTYLVLNITKTSKIINWVITGSVFGLVILIRPTNGIIGLLLIIPICKIYKEVGLKNLLKSHYFKIFTLLFSSLLFFLPQIIYWIYTTGNPLYFSYVGESFNFLHPEFLNVLFSVRKGLFFWSPILLLLIPGFYLALKNKKYSALIFLLILVVQFYLVSSWWAWSYGYSFGHRAFSEFLLFFAIIIGFFVNKIFSLNSKSLKQLIIIVMLILIFINLFQMQQYWRGLIHPDGETPETYQKIFLQPCIGAIPQLRCDWF